MREAIQRQMQSTRREILTTLKKRGGMTADELSEILGITAMGVRRHLMTLERDGLVEYKPVQRGVGRPSYVYSLTDLADDLFPKNYDRFAKELLDIVRTLDGEEKVEELFAKRMERLEATYAPHLANKNLADQIAELTRIQNENGYLAKWEQVDDNTFVFLEHNCAIAKIASECQFACDYELKLLNNLLDAEEIVREDHMASGDIGCRYRIIGKPSAKSS
ncbi:MAG: helix-turn-helix transcriptional regulator [Anaerolineae bacterium]